MCRCNSVSKAVAFGLVFVLMATTVEYALLRVDFRTFLTMNDMKYEDDIEWLFLGNSTSITNINPFIIEEETDHSAFILARISARMPGCVAMLKQLYCEGHKPEKVVFVLDSLMPARDSEDISVMAALAPFLAPHVRLDYIRATASIDDLWLDRTFLWRYDSNQSLEDFQKSLQAKNAKSNTEKIVNVANAYYSNRYLGRGHMRAINKHYYDQLARASHTIVDTKILDLSEAFLQNFNELRDICKQNGAEFIVCVVPIWKNLMFADQRYSTACNAVAEYCASEGVPFFNFNYYDPERAVNLDPYFNDAGDHLLGEGADLFTREMLAEVLNKREAGEDVSSFFVTHEEWEASVDYLTDAWFVSDEKDGVITYTAYAHHGTPVKPLFQFVQVAEDGSETVLREYSAETAFSIAKDEVVGQVRMYAMNGAAVEQEPLVYELN